jgi:hypothetical protein
MKAKIIWPLLVGWALMVPYYPSDINGQAAAGRLFEIAETQKDKNTHQWMMAKCVPMDLIYKVKP